MNYSKKRWKVKDQNLGWETSESFIKFNPPVPPIRQSHSKKTGLFLFYE